MFGGSRKNNNSSSNNSLSASVMSPEGPPSSNSNKNSVTGFDPEGLERAAKAARDLDNSKNASAAIELIKVQELTKQVCLCVCFVWFVLNLTHFLTIDALTNY